LEGKSSLRCWPNGGYIFCDEEEEDFYDFLNYRYLEVATTNHKGITNGIILSYDKNIG